MKKLRMLFAPPLLAAVGAALMAAPALAQTGGGYDLTWSTVDCGGQTNPSGGGTFAVAGTAGQPDAGTMSGGGFVIIGGFWSPTAPIPCYANCDASTVTPFLNVLDFTCFLQRFSAGDSYANCDGSTAPPVLNFQDFSCFLQKFSAGCP
jgi:hypothetical protein